MTTVDVAPLSRSSGQFALWWQIRAEQDQFFIMQATQRHLFTGASG